MGTDTGRLCPFTCLFSVVFSQLLFRGSHLVNYVANQAIRTKHL